MGLESIGGFLMTLLSGIFAILKAKFPIGITGIIILISLFGAISQSAQQHSVQPIIDEVGRSTYGIDAVLQKDVAAIALIPTWNWEKISLAWDIFEKVTMLIVLFFVFYKAIDIPFSDASTLAKLILSGVLIYLLSIIASLTFTGTAIFPFNGIWNLIQYLLGTYQPPIETSEALVKAF